MTILREHRWQRVIRKAKGFFGCRPLAVGVDCGSRMIKTVALQMDRDGLALHDFSMQPVIDRSLQDKPLNAELVGGMKEKITIPLKTLGTSLSGASAFVKSLSLPVMTEEDLRDHLALELDRYIALDAQEVFWDVYHRKSLSETMDRHQEYFLVVAKKTCVEHQVDMFRQCGVTVRFVDVDAFALTNLVTYNYGTEGAWLLAHIGPTGIMMVIIVEGEPSYVRNVAYEVEWYGDLLEQVSISQTSLESRKELGPSETLLLESFFQETREQICATLESFSDCSTTVIDRGVLLSGGYSVAPEMARTLAHSLGMAVHLLDPFESITVSQAIHQDPTFQQMAPLMSVAVGVAVRGACSHD